MGHLWLVFIGVALVNLAIAWVRAPAKCDDDPERVRIARALAVKIALATGAPFLVMGLGVELANVPMNGFLRPTNDPFVLAFKALLALELLAGTIWIFGGGAATLATHAWMFRGEVTSVRAIRVLWVLMVLGAGVSLALSFVPR